MTDSCVPELDLWSGDIRTAFYEYYSDNDPKKPIYEVAEILLEIFKQSFGIMRGPGFGRDELVFFDPTRGIWTTDKNVLRALAEIVRPGLSHIGFGKIEDYIATSCLVENHIVQEYTGSRYIAFKNGVLDVFTLELLPPSSPKVRDLCLTSRNELSVSWNPDAEAVTFSGKGYQGGDWNIKDYFMAYAEEDEERYRFLMFLLSFGLFGSHTPGVHTSFIGSSKIGKMAISQWLKVLYQPDQFTFLNVHEMEKPFPLSDHGYHKTILWIYGVDEETNQPSSGAITLYNKLADASISLSVRHRGDFVYEPGPTYLEGTVPMKVDDIQTGCKRRTLVYHFADNLDSPEAKRLYYTDDLKRMQSDSRNLEWFVKECINAYRHYIPESQIDNLKLCLTNSKDLEFLPDFAKQWREKAIASSNERFSH